MTRILTLLLLIAIAGQFVAVLSQSAADEADDDGDDGTEGPAVERTTFPGKPATTVVPAGGVDPGKGSVDSPKPSKGGDKDASRKGRGKGKGKGENKEIKSAEGNNLQACNPMQIMLTESCCSMPLLPRDKLRVCMPMPGIEEFKKAILSKKRGKRAPFLGGMLPMMRGMGGGLGNTLKGLGSGAAGVVAGVSGNMAPPSPACVAECVFRNTSLLTESGEVDLARYQDALMQGADPSWKSGLDAAFASCTAEYNKLSADDLAEISAPGGKKCKPGSYYISACIRRYNALNCPAQFKKEGVACGSAFFDGLRNCTPFKMAASPFGKLEQGENFEKVRDEVSKKIADFEKFLGQ